MNELPASPASLMHLMPSTSQQITTFSRGIIEAVKNGEENPLDVMLQIRALEKSFKFILDEIKDNVNREADKYPGVSFRYRGNELVKGDVSTTYDYSICCDTEWERRKVDADAAKERLQEREGFLKALKEPLEVCDTVTGEMITIRPPLKKTVQGVKFFIK